MKPAEFFTRLSEGFRRFGTLEARGSSPLYALLASELADRPDVLAVLEAADPRQRRPNLLFAAVHDVLLSGVEHELSDYYPSAGGDRAPDQQTTEMFVEFLDEHRGKVLERITGRSTQTNEVRRAALLRPALHRIADEVDRPLGLVEVGAAAGLLLLVDRYAYDYGDNGDDNGDLVLSCRSVGSDLPPIAPPFTIGTRLGIDLNPLDPADPGDARWLQACIWPEHTERRRLLERALEVAAEDRPLTLRGEALDLLSDAVARIPADHHAVVFHCATLAYFPTEARQAFVDLLHAVARTRPLSWIAIEGPFLPALARQEQDADQEPPDTTYFQIGLSRLPKDSRLLASADPHGTWIQWLET